MKYVGRYNKKTGKLEWQDGKVPPSPKSAGCAFTSRTFSEDRPWKSRALACHRSQAAEFNRDLEREGIKGARYERDGTFVATSRQARNQVLKYRGFRDNDAGYGDWAGNS